MADSAAFYSTDFGRFAEKDWCDFSKYISFVLEENKKKKCRNVQNKISYSQVP